MGELRVLPTDNAEDGDCWHQIDEDLYEAVYIGDVSDLKLWGGKRVARFKIITGPHADKTLRFYAQIPRAKDGSIKNEAGRSKIAVSYFAVTGRKPPRNVATMKLDWLKKRVLEVEVGDAVPRDGSAPYSVVSRILRPITETER